VTGVSGGPRGAGSGFVSLSGLTKSFGEVAAVSHLDLDVEQGEFFSMLGPSGSGKTTVLRLIAGFETATSGNALMTTSFQEHLLVFTC